MERKLAAPTLMDGLAADLGGPRTQAFFDKCSEHIPWARLAASLEGLYGDHAEGGRPPWPLVLMVKCLMLQKWFNLSDPQLEEQLKDRISFRRFVGLSLTDATPDETTFVKFRKRLAAAGHGRSLFDAVVKHLDRCGLIMKDGTLVDASIIEAPRGHQREDGTSTRDRQASYTRKHGRTYHGYKSHIATDRRGVIKDYRYTTAKVHDSQMMDELIAGEQTAAYGDSAYMDERRRERLQSRGVLCGIIRRRVRGQKELDGTTRLINRFFASIRAAVEHPMAWIRNMGHRRVRYRGLLPNAMDFGLMAAAYNLKRSFSLRAAI
jgi:transposase, IS5 family